MTVVLALIETLREEADELKVENERLRAELKEAMAYTLSERWSQQAATIADLMAALKEITELSDLYHPSQRIARATLVKARGQSSTADLDMRDIALNRGPQK